MASRSRFGVVALLYLTSCGSPGGPQTVPVTGTIHMGGGAPVAGATVVFTPTDSADGAIRAAQAETDEAGEFKLETYVDKGAYRDGVLPGEYSVTVTKLELVTDMRRQPKHLLPRKYRLPSTTDLRAVVASEGENHFQFDLQ